jgi:hypothetical protein
VQERRSELDRQRNLNFRFPRLSLQCVNGRLGFDVCCGEWKIVTGCCWDGRLSCQSLMGWDGVKGELHLPLLSQAVSNLDNRGPAPTATYASEMPAIPLACRRCRFSELGANLDPE